MSDHYKIEKRVELDELCCKMTQFRHIKSGARVLHIENDDPENLFCLAFRTLPKSSNGVAHILEHTVLCGSQKYPVKDPFFCMIRRSLNTFMNAMTADDMTFYPAASQVKEDFYNLLEVYIDAVFHPNLNRLSFLQEGHRLEFATPDDPKSDLTYGGVVFNEMKGALASAESRIWYRLAEELYPDSPYQYNSGGDPAEIPNLTYEELLKFHKQHYHPARCLYFFYGDMPIDEHLDFLHDKVLNGTRKVKLNTDVPRQERKKAPVRITDTYPIAPEDSLEEKALVAFGWLTCLATNQLELLALEALGIILMGSDAAPLKTVLLKSGLCKEAYVALDADAIDVAMVLFLKGCEGEKVTEIEKLIFATLKTIAKEGVSEELIDGAIHQLEFGRKEIHGDGTPYGLTLFQRTIPLMLHGGKPEEGLQVHSLFDKLRKAFDKPDYVKKLINQYLVTNKHWVRILMEPDLKRAQEEQDREEEQLEKIKAKLSEEQMEEIIHDSLSLASFQDEKEEDLSCLPKIAIENVPKGARDFDLAESDVKPFHLYHHDCFTNHICYATVAFDLPEIAPERLPYVRLFGALLPELGCGGRNYAEHLELVQQHTGGIGIGLDLHSQATDHNQLVPALIVGGRALEHKVDRFFPILLDTLTTPDFTDRERLKELLMQQYSILEHSLTHKALRYAVSLAGSGLSYPAAIGNQWYGIDYLQFIRNLMADLDKNMDGLIRELTTLQKELLGAGTPHLLLGCDQEMRAELDKEKFYGLLDLPTHKGKPWTGNGPQTPVPSQARVIASPVAFTCRMLPGLPYAHPQSPALNIAARLFEHTTLHPEIREKGGAYGSGAKNNPNAGTFYFFAYRDPNIVSSLRAMDKAVTRISGGKFTNDALEEAKLTMIQRLDSPTSPGSRAEVAYSRLREGRPHKMRQLYRDRLLALSSDDVAEAVATYIQPYMEDSVITTFAGEELIKKENRRLSKASKPTLDVLPI